MITQCTWSTWLWLTAFRKIAAAVPLAAILAAILNDARNNPDLRPAAESRCAVLLNADLPDPGLAALVSGLLDVPKKRAVEAYCAAMVEASIANELSEADLRRLQVPREVRGMGAFGDMLRKVIVAHQRLKSRQLVTSMPLRSRPARN